MEYCCHIWVSIPTFNLNMLDKPLGHRVNVTSFSHIYSISSNKYCSSDSHHGWKNKKTTGQIKFLAVTIKQQIKLVLSCNILCKSKFNVLVQMFLLHSFIFSIFCLVKSHIPIYYYIF